MSIGKIGKSHCYHKYHNNEYCVYSDVRKVNIWRYIWNLIVLYIIPEYNISNKNTSESRPL